MTKLSEKIISHIQQQAENIDFGKITIVLMGNSDVDVICEERTRFKSETLPSPGMLVDRKKHFRDG